MPRPVILALASEPQEAILRAALNAHDVRVTGLPPSAHIESAVMQAMREMPPPVLLIDIAALAHLAMDAEAFCTWRSEHCAKAELLLFCSGLQCVNAQAHAWAQSLGAGDLLPGCEIAHWHSSLLPTVTAILSAAGMSANKAAIEHAMQSLPRKLDHSTRVSKAWNHLDLLREFSTDPGALIDILRSKNGVPIDARRYRTRVYDECFVGVAAVDVIVHATGATRAEAVRMGQTLLELGHLYHVVREQPFQDSNFYYRVSADTPRLNALDLTLVTKRMHDGIKIRDRKFNGVRYPTCYVGSDAMAWMRTTYQLSVNEAMTLGQRLIDLFIVHHVVDDQPFRDGKFFYRFYRDET